MKRISIPLLLAVSLTVVAQDKPPGLNDFSLKDLMQVEVTTVSKKPQKLANVAAAVYVISAEDIRMSGANSLPEVLRMAPGVDATRISGNRWAVSIRGFATRLSNKLLVLVDGRNAYSPAFSGVFWDFFQFPMEDIERIEVVRGPSAAVWGSNGVNGIINIITKSAAATQGGQAVMGGGNVEGAYGRVSWGGQNADGNVFYRVYGAKQNANSQNAPGGGDGMDTYGLEATGFRMDGYLTDGARWDVSGDFQTMHANLGISLTLPDTVTDNYGRENNSGQALRGRYIQPLAHGGDLQIQAAFAHTELDMGVLLADLRNTFDIDAQHHFKLGERHDIVWGGGYRLTTDSMPTTPMFSIREASRRTSSYGIFGQDEMTLTDDWRLTLGLRMDHNEFTGWEAQPDARLSWHLAPNHTLWGALSKASRAPSRGEQGSTISFIGDSTTLAPGLTVPNVLRYTSEGIPSEQLKATQMGLRSQWAPVLSTDMVLFSHKYDHISSFDINDIQTVPHMVGPNLDYLDIYIPYAHQGELTLNGVEMTVDWRPSKNWNLRFSQTWQDVVPTGLLLVDGSGSIPRQITSLHASWMPTSAMDINFWLRRTSERLGTEPDRPTDARSAFYGVDLSATWRPRQNLELSLIGQNLNDGACGAYANVAGADIFPGLLPTCMPRSLSAQLRVNF
jgi:iron complex outermembrane recepter protein